MIPRYTREPLDRIWSDRARYERWLDVELAWARELERAGQVPAGTADAVENAVRIDPARIEAIEETTRHDVIAFLTSVEEQAGEAARAIHLGLTSSDVLDTALALQLVEATEAIDDELARVLRQMRNLALRYRHTPMVGRTHGVHAEPIVFGLVAAGWFAEFFRQRSRLASARDSIAVGKLAGAVGTYAHGDPEAEARALTALALSPEPAPTQVVSRDRHAYYFCVLAGIASSVERVAVTIRHLQRTEVLEVEEPFAAGQKGSSAMPHKRNPVLSENLTGLARLVRSYALASLENVALWHERDISHSSVERVVAPDATTLVHFMLVRLRGILAGLRVDAARMRSNLERTRGLIYSHTVLVELVRRGVARQTAYEWVQRCAMEAWEHGRDFHSLLADDPNVSKVLDAQALAACFDLDRHLRHVDTIIARVFGPHALDAVARHPHGGGEDGDAGGAA